MSSPPTPADAESSDPPLPEIVGASPAMQDVYRIVRRVARSNANVLLLGESGTGKRLFARAIHQLNGQATGPSVQVHCGSARDGCFDSAKSGTLILLDVDLLPAASQAELLEQLPEIRAIATSIRDLWAEVREGRFREDLYYRLSVVPIQLPPLRARPEDIRPLCDHFLRAFSRPESASDEAAGAIRIDAQALAALEAYHWPGNIGELPEACIERAVALAAGDELTSDLLPPNLLGGKAARGVRRGGALGAVDLETLTGELVHQGLAATGPDADGLHSKIVDRVERELIVQVMAACDNVRTKAAARLGMNRNTLHKKLKEYGLEGSEASE